MLDTGIDVPEVLNLVFFKLVRSKTKLWQMVGRGTRLCPDLFEPGQHKEFFYIFDYCQNLEYFSQNPQTTDGSLGESLGKRLFKTRLELISELDRKQSSGGKQDAETELRHDLVTLLQGEVAAMNVENFVVRAKRRLVEKYAKPEIWGELQPESFSELAREIAGLPSELDAEDEDAKRFDLLMLNLQLAVLRAEPAFKRLSTQVKEIAGLLEEKSSIPMVREQMALIQDIQTDEWWKDVTTPMLETVRRRLRALIKLIEKCQRNPVYTNFEDKIGEGEIMELPVFATRDSYERFRAKTRQFLNEHENDLVIHKVRMNEPLTPSDLQELERMLSALSNPEHLIKAKTENHGLGLFVRSLVGLDRQVAKQAFSGFTAERILTANQIEFVNLIVDHLTEHGAMDAALLYESPFTDLNPQGPEGIFVPAQVEQLVTLLSEIRARAVA